MAQTSIKSKLILTAQAIALVLVMAGCQLGKDWDNGGVTNTNVNSQSGNTPPTIDVKKVCPPGVDCVNQTKDNTSLDDCNSTTTAANLYGMWIQGPRGYSDNHTETTYYTFSKDSTGSLITLSVSTVCKGSGDAVTATASSKLRVSAQNVVVEQDTEDDTSYTLPNNVKGVCKAWTTQGFFTYKMQGTCLVLSSNVFTINPEFFIPVQQ